MGCSNSLSRIFFSIASLVAVSHSSPLNRRSTPGVPSGVPSYVLDYAPLVYLHAADPYRPSDISAQLVSTVPQVNFKPVSASLVSEPLTLNNLDQLNALGGKNLYLTSKDDVTTNPTWLQGVTPDSSGKTNNVTTTAVIVYDHGDGVVDVFYMYFYAYNWGGKFLDQNLGNHVGDWEHNMIRFKQGVPNAVWYSQHSNGEAFVYNVLQKEGLRPIVYSANGSHANYAIPGKHDHVIPNLNLPNGLLLDYTSKDLRWDPLLSAYFYSYSPTNNGTFTPYDNSTPVAWLNFTGHWGDQQYPDSDKRQKKFFGQPKYAGGPTGPKDKQLVRKEVCPSNGIVCILRPILTPRGDARNV